MDFGKIYFVNNTAYSRRNFRDNPKKIVSDDLGDCIDCHQCVDVCPTGIDIRNGTQLECINCTACIDACDTVMEKVDRPKGLIRYDSIDGINKGEKFSFTFRNIGYSAILVVLTFFFFLMLFTRSDAEATVLRSYGTQYQEAGNNHYTNLFTVKVLNKTFEAMPIRLELLNPDGTSAAPWIHKLALSAFLFIFIPRTLLALGYAKLAKRKIKTVENRRLINRALKIRSFFCCRRLLTVSTLPSCMGMYVLLSNTLLSGSL